MAGDWKWMLVKALYNPSHSMILCGKEVNYIPQSLSSHYIMIRTEELQFFLKAWISIVGYFIKINNNPYDKEATKMKKPLDS